MSIFKRINDKIGGWLFKEEIQAQAEQAQNVSRERAEMERALSDAMEAFKVQAATAKREYELCCAEDHSKAPTDADITRYYGYHVNYVANMKYMAEKAGLWVTNEQVLMEESEYANKCRERGWDFMRESCGLPKGKIDQTPWNCDEQNQWSANG